jgi:hypothetical protein
MILQHKLVKEPVNIDVGFLVYRLEYLFVTGHEILFIFLCILLYVHADWSRDFKMTNSYVGERKEETGEEKFSK